MVALADLAVLEKRLPPQRARRYTKEGVSLGEAVKLPNYELLIPQSHHRVNFRGPPGGDVARGQRDQSEQGSHCSEG